jgi:hypothetical protein
MDERSRLIEQAEHCRRIAEKINHAETAEAIRKLAQEYEQKAESLPPATAENEKESPR